jgi:hypothetical protein
VVKSFFYNSFIILVILLDFSIFQTDTDFQAVLESFAEFTSHQLRLGVSSPREMEGYYATFEQEFFFFINFFFFLKDYSEII